MAQETKDKEREVDEEDRDDSSEDSSEPAGGADALARTDSSDDASIGGGAEAAPEGDAPEGDAAEGEDETAAAQLGADRYVLAGFFAAGMIGAYVLGRAIQSAWVALANKYSQNQPWLAAISDEDKPTYSIVVGGLIALVAVYRTYNRPDVRAWTGEVAGELAKVVWPSRKEVTNSTFIVIVSTVVSTVYLALLDRLWAFVTNIVYGDGS